MSTRYRIVTETKPASGEYGPTVVYRAQFRTWLGWRDINDSGYALDLGFHNPQRTREEAQECADLHCWQHQRTVVTVEGYTPADKPTEAG